MTNVREVDVEVLDLWFEGRAHDRRYFRRAGARLRPHVWPPTDWFVEGAGTIPGTVQAHHTEMYAFRTEDLGMALRDDGHRTYRPVVACAGGKAFRGDWLEASPTPETKA